jgi:lysophospholipase L1-like esterase
MKDSKIIMLMVFVVMVWWFSGCGPVVVEEEADQNKAVRVWNCGVPGNNSQDLLNRLERDCLSLCPDVVVMMVGTNDFLSSTHCTSADVYARNLDSLVVRIMAKSRLIVLTILPVREHYLLTRHPKDFFPNGCEEKVLTANRIVKEVCARRGCWLVDMNFYYELLAGNGVDDLLRTPQNSGMTDGVHPTPGGYKVMALVVSYFMAEHGIAPRRLVCFGDSIMYGSYMVGAGGAGLDDETFPGYLGRLLNYE